MGIWYLCRNDPRAEDRLALARAQIMRHGHREPEAFGNDAWRGLWAGHIHPGLATFARDGADYIAIAGTLIYRGAAGEDGLLRFLRDYAPPFRGWADVLGHFAAVLYKSGRFFLLTDWFANFCLYQTEDRSVFSTSLLATARSCPRLSFDTQGVYEFVFTGAPMGQASVFNEISRPDRSEELELLPDGKVLVHATPRSFAAIESPEAMPDLLNRVTEKLRAMFDAAIWPYGDNIQCPLSGGFDSRLVLALLQERGVRPHVYVYGKPGDMDVEIAEHIAKSEGFALERFEKASAYIEPDAFAAMAEKNFHEMDGTPMDGGMFDGGGNSAGRHRRAENGALAVSGAAGEIFRNYFYLADRPMRASAVIDAFYSAFDPRSCTSLFDERLYRRRLTEKLQLALGVGEEVVPRLDIERAYPMFRSPHAFGREISMVGRFGAYFLPFCEPLLVRETVGIPVKWRTHGILQSALIARINRRLAAYPSAYGHSFVEPPNLRHRLADAISLYRPPWLRRYSFRFNQRYRPQPPRDGGYLAPAYLCKVIDLSFPYMSRYFAIPHITSHLHYGTIATLEYLAQHFSDRLATR